MYFADLIIIGTLVSVDQFLNIKLDEIEIGNEDESLFPHMVGVSFVPLFLCTFLISDKTGTFVFEYLSTLLTLISCEISPSYE
jgi:hypothetical protein